ncbi:MAG: hypothetical protein N2201_05200 [candidate division WOR-3 bacterium]|nr:hypothetical protein [candidate division WOR-3 bacterium]
MNPEIEQSFKLLEEKIDKLIATLNNLKQENDNLQAELQELKSRQEKAIERINLLLDNLSKLL